MMEERYCNESGDGGCLNNPAPRARIEIVHQRGTDVECSGQRNYGQKNQRAPAASGCQAGAAFDLTCRFEGDVVRPVNDKRRERQCARKQRVPIEDAGILDWYTLLTGALALAALIVHGAHYIALKTTGEVESRARLTAARGWRALVLLTIVSLPATFYVRPALMNNFYARPWGWIIQAAAVAALVAIPLFHHRKRA